VSNDVYRALSIDLLAILVSPHIITSFDIERSVWCCKFRRMLLDKFWEHMLQFAAHKHYKTLKYLTNNCEIFSWSIELEEAILCPAF